MFLFLRCESRAALRRYSITEASILLGTDVKLMPLQLSQICASPFLKSLTSIPLVQSFGTFSLFQMATRRAVHTNMQARRDAFSISAVILSTPGALPFFSFFTAVVTSSVLGGSALTSICKNGVSGTISGSSGLGLFKTFSKCEAHVSSAFCGSEITSHFHLLQGMYDLFSFQLSRLLVDKPFLSLLSLQLLLQALLFSQ